MDTERTILKESDLLDALQQWVGCPYLSNLHEPQWADAVRDALKCVPDARYPVGMWRRAAEYIMGRACEGTTVAQIRESLAAYLVQFGRRG